MLRQRTVGEQMQELPERVKKFFVEWVQGGCQGKYLLDDGRMILQDYLEGTKRVGIVAYQYDAFKATLMHELDSHKVDFLCHLLMANGQGQDFGETGLSVVSLTVEETMKFLTTLPDVQLSKDFEAFEPMIGGFRDSLLINFFLTVEAIRRGFCDTTIRNTEEFRLYNWYSSFRTNDNQQRSSAGSQKAPHVPQSFFWPRLWSSPPGGAWKLTTSHLAPS